MSLTHLALPPSKLVEATLRCLYARLTPLITSSPGMGKSDIVRDIAKRERLKVIDFRVPQADVTDFCGLPFRNDQGKAEFMPFDLFPLEGDDLPSHPDGGTYEGWLLFLDELTSAPKHLQSPAYKLILDRMVGNHKLHERVVICAAGNLAGDKAIVHEMSTALQSRMIHLELRLDHNEWVEWAIKHELDSRVISFLQFKPDLLHRFNPEHTDKTFACPRTWEFTSKLVKNREVNMQDLPLLAGTISSGVAQDFLSYVQIWNELPKIENIIADPENIVIPHDPGIKFALATVLSERMDNTNVDKLALFLGRLPVECRVLSLRMLRVRNASLMRNTAIQKVFQPLLAKM